MKWAFLSFRKYSEETSPELWLESTAQYRGVLEALAQSQDITSLEGIGFQGEYRLQKVQYCFINKSGLSLAWESIKVLKALKPKIILVHSFQFPLHTLILKWIMGKETIFFIQNHAEKPPKNIKSWAQKWVDSYIFGYFFCSKEMGKEWVENGIIRSNEKIKEAMEVSSFFKPMPREEAQAFTKAQGNPVLLWVGRLENNKDPITVIQGFLKYAKFNPLARLYMIFQSGELISPIQKILKASPERDQVILVGKVNHKDLEFWYNSADIFISGSHYEGSGTAASEAISCGCLPVLTQIPSFRMMTRGGETGFLYEPGNSEALWQILKNWNKTKVEKMKIESLEYFNSHLSFEAIAVRLQEFASSA